MAHFAKLDENNKVVEVIVVNNAELIDENGQESEQKGIDFLISWSGGYTNWKQTSYNASFRKNYAGYEYVYDTQRDAFIPPKMYSSWLLNEETCQWEPPISYPNDGFVYIWNEEIQNWEKTEGIV
jgi:hypothetical protein